jgi:membrane protease YdiL (CAAX protease family)
MTANEPAASRKRFWPWIACAPLTRIVVFAMLLIGLLFVCRQLMNVFGLPASLDQASYAQLLPIMLLNLFAFGFAYWLMVRWLEQRKLDELAIRELLPDAAIGLAIGGGLMLLVTGVLWLSGAYRVVGVQADAPWLRGLLLVGVLAGVTEEILFRGVIYRIVEDGMGSWVALAVSSLLFGFVHAMNPGATLWSCIAIAIEAGLLLGLLYTVTRSLYMCMGLHAGWNFVQGSVLGIPVSGTAPHGLLVATLSGPRWLSGGAFGAEASAVSVVLLGAVSCVLAVHAVRHGLIKPPFWRRQARIEIAELATRADA